MLTLIATCLLAAGTTFTPLPEWTITEIVGGGIPTQRHGLLIVPSLLCMDNYGRAVRCSEPEYTTRITMRRLLAPGQIAEPPQGCTLKIEVKE